MGVNYVDIYHRTGLYPLPLPTGLGTEAAGRVEAVGPGVETVRPGDRVVYISPPGAYAEARVFPAERLVKLQAMEIYRTQQRAKAQSEQGVVIEDMDLSDSGIEQHIVREVNSSMVRSMNEHIAKHQEQIIEPPNPTAKATKPQS